MKVIQSHVKMGKIGLKNINPKLAEIGLREMDLHWTRNMALLLEGGCQGREQRPGSLAGKKGR